MVSKALGGPTWPFTRIGGIGAIVFAAAIIGINLILFPAGLPEGRTGIADTTRFFDDNGEVVRWALAATPVAFFAVVTFGAGAFAALREFERADISAWSLVGLAGLILQTATFTVVSALRLALTTIPEHTSATAAGLFALHNAVFNLNGTFLATAMIGLSMGGLRARLIQPWHAALGFIAAALQFTWTLLTPLMLDRPSPLALVGLVGWLIWTVWLVVYGITLIRLRANRLAVAS
ncbi:MULTISPECIES: DUF4386 family protein [unclassified Nocardia]|uniref:DUF4386 family protein n=1 Tax=unclassified Nocardia TaxID=2637762 RepID=UPI001CE40214|nr:MULTISPECIES: DUF4386 family protein [unclassified Nocardia]